MAKREHSDSVDTAAIARSLDDAPAFGELFERHFALVHRFLSLRVGEESAGDLASETFVIAFRRRGDYDLTRPDARPWLLGIAANLARQQHRKERRGRDTLLRLAREEHIESRDGSPAADAAADFEDVRAALAELDPEARDLLLLFACVGLSYAEISEALAVPLGTVRSRIHRLRHALRERLSLPAEEVRA